MPKASLETKVRNKEEFIDMADIGMPSRGMTSQSEADFTYDEEGKDKIDYEDLKIIAEIDGLQNNEE